MHILIVPSFYPTTRSKHTGIFIRDQALALSKAGHRVGVAFFDARSWRSISLCSINRNLFRYTYCSDFGVAMTTLQGWNPGVRYKSGGRLWASLAVAAGRRYAATYGVPDVVHAHCLFWAGFAALRLAEEWGRPALLTEHGGSMMARMSAPHQKAVSATLPNFSKVICVSHALQKAMMEVRADVSSVVVPNIVDDIFFESRWRHRPQGKYVFVHASSMDSNKRTDLLVQAFASAFPPGHEAELWIIGNGAGSRQLINLVGQFGLRGRVFMLGVLSRPQMAEVLSRGSCAVSTSRVETFGLFLAEALAAGMPVVTTASGGPADFVNSGNGMLLERANQASLAEALRTMYGAQRASSRPELSMSVAAFRGDRVAQTLSKVYFDLYG
ncbi:MAG: glycosyltransferase [Thermoleophilia bacterium]